MIFCNVILLVMKLIIDRYIVSLLSKLIKNYTNDTVLIKVNSKGFKWHFCLNVETVNSSYPTEA